MKEVMGRVVSSVVKDGGGGAVARAAVKRVIMRSQFTPDVEVQPFGDNGTATTVKGDPATNSVTNAILGVVQPAFYVETAAGLVPLEPYGRPSGRYVPLLVVGGVVVTLGAAYVCYRAVLSFFK